jgi:hypothetical protein
MAAKLCPIFQVLRLAYRDYNYNIRQCYFGILFYIFYISIKVHRKDHTYLWYMTKTNIDHTLNEFNKLQLTIKFTIEKEQQESIDFLYLTIHLLFSIYGTSRQTDIRIPNSSCHLYEHKLSGIKYIWNRLHSYPITEKAKDAEKNTTKYILHNNEYDTIVNRKPLPQQKQKQNTHADSQHQKTKNKVGYFHIQRQRSKKNYKTFSGHANKNSLPHTEQNKKYIKASATNR